MSHSHPLLLIVEDDYWTRYILVRILRHQGWDVVAVGTVAEGIGLLAEEPDCVVVDLQLADGMGESLIGRIREARLVSRVVVCTAVRDSGRLEGLRDFTPDAVIYKPVDMRQLLEACHA